MGRFTVRLPDTLHHRLVEQAKTEGVSLNQYVVFLLASQMPLEDVVELVSLEDVKQQNEQFKTLEARKDASDRNRVAEYLATREVVEPENEHAAELITQVQEKINESSSVGTAPQPIMG